jgi:peptide/nickel transport system substrate-binding protein/oligopeptide transport system substrate-binding protein
MRRSHLALSLLVCAGAAPGCRGEAGAPSRRTIVDSRDTYDPRSLDPAKSTDVPTGRAVAYVFDGLVRFTPDARTEPGLAHRWDVSPDGRVYTFHLRPGVKFHDGTPFVARHVVRSFERVLDPAQRGGRGWPLYPIQGARAFTDGKAKTVAGLRAPDDSTVVITLTEPLAVFTKLLAMPVAAIVPENTGPDFDEKPVGTGPWKFVEWRHDDYLKFARNPDYFGGAPAADSLIARIIPEPSTQVAEFESGNVDVLIVPQSETRSWEQTDERSARLQTGPALTFYYIAINTTRGPLTDARVRRAINHAIDTRTIVRQLVAGRGTAAAGVIPPSLPGADTTRQPYPYDSARARRLLAEAGHPNGIDVELWASQDATIARITTAVQGYLNAAGIRAKIVQRDASSVREASRNGQTDLFVKTWYADYPDAENFLYPLLHSANKGVGGNVSFFANARFDSLVTLSRRTLDDQARENLYRQADAIAFEEAPIGFLFFYNDLYAVQPWIKGFQVPAILNGQRWTTVTIDPTGTR